jgi:hypothetical protein
MGAKEGSMKSWCIVPLLLVLAGAGAPGAAADDPPKDRPLRKADELKTNADYLKNFRRIAWYYDFATASELARETGRPMFVIFCRASTLTDPVSKEPRCSS